MKRGNLRWLYSSAVAAGLSLVMFFAPVGIANSATLGVNMIGEASPGGWNTGSLTGYTFGFKFNLASDTAVSGLGFWDLDGTFTTAAVGLWKADGTLVGSVNNTTSSVRTEPTPTGVGSWYFMDFNTVLAAGDYIVGSYTNDTEYRYILKTNAAGKIAFDTLTYVSPYAKNCGGSLCLPNYDGTATQYYGYFGANIEFGAPSAVPLPAALPLFTSGLGALGLFGWHRKRKAKAIAA